VCQITSVENLTETFYSVRRHFVQSTNQGQLRYAFWPFEAVGPIQLATLRSPPPRVPFRSTGPQQPACARARARYCPLVTLLSVSEFVSKHRQSSTLQAGTNACPPGVDETVLGSLARISFYNLFLSPQE
jgi:hypothetical protein